MTDHAHTIIPHEVEWAVGMRDGWYLSVCDLNQPKNHQFLGAFITAELDLTAASDSAWRATGLRRNIQIAAFPYPSTDLAVVSPSDRDRLLSVSDLARLGENTHSAGEMGYW